MVDNEICLVEVGNRIMQRRKSMGLTQEALAEKADLTTQFVSYAESGKRAMRPEKQRFTRGYKRYKETSGLTEWKIGHIFHSIFT